MKKFIPILAAIVALAGALMLTRSTTAQVGGSGLVTFTDICLDYYYIAKNNTTGEEVSGNVWPVMADGTMGDVTLNLVAGSWSYELYRQDGLVERGSFVLGNGQSVNIWSSNHNCPVPRTGNLTVAAAIVNGSAEVAANPSGVYTIVAGDTIEIIAAKLGVQVRILLVTNPWLVIPMSLTPGDTVIIPGQADFVISAAAQASAAAAVPAASGAPAAVAATGPSAVQAVGSGSAGGQIAVRTNAGAGECGTGNANGQFQEVLNRLAGTLRYDNITLKDVGIDRNGDVCITISTKFFGGNGRYTVFVNGVQVGYRGPHLESRLDGEYGFLDFDLISGCNQEIELTINLVAADGQSISEIFRVFVPCPAGNAGAASGAGAAAAASSSSAAASNTGASTIAAATGPSTLQAVGTGANGSAISVRSNAGAGECGTASAAGLFQEVLNRLSGGLRFDNMQVKEVSVDRNGDGCITMTATFFGGSGSYTVFVNGVQVGYRGPHLQSRLDGEYAFMDFDIVAACDQVITLEITIQSSDGQSTTQTFSEFVACTFAPPAAPVPVSIPAPTAVPVAVAAPATNQTVVGSGSGGGQIVVIDNASAGECGAGVNTGETVPKVAGGMRVEEITLREVAHFRRTQVCVTFDLLFFGGTGPHSISVNGVSVDHRGPHLVSRLDGEFGYLAYDLIVDCNQTYDMNVTLTSADGQNAVGNFSQFIACP